MVEVHQSPAFNSLSIEKIRLKCVSFLLNTMIQATFSWLGPPVVPFLTPFLVGRVSPTKIDYRKKEVVPLF